VQFFRIFKIHFNTNSDFVSDIENGNENGSGK